MRYHLDFDLDFKRNPYPGKFIVIEGLDGAGKTTQVRSVADVLSKDRTVFLTKNPTDSEIGKFIRKILIGQINIPPVSFQYMFSADRQIQQGEILEHLKKEEMVISHRYFWSSVAYGVADREDLNLETDGNLLLVSQSILSMYHRFIVPDLTIYLDVPVETAIERLSQMHKPKELYEKKEKLQLVEAGYRFLIQTFPDEITVVDGTKPVGKITEEILKILNFKFKILTV